MQGHVKCQSAMCNKQAPDCLRAEGPVSAAVDCLLQVLSKCSNDAGTAKQARILFDAETVKRLDSSLLLGWAKQVESLVVDEYLIMIPGLDGFMAAATSLTTLFLTCRSPLMAAVADHLLSVTPPALSDLQVHGSDKPCFIPLSVTKVHANFACPSDARPWDSSQVDSFLYHCARLPRLHELTIGSTNHFAPDDGMDAVRLTCPIQLPHVDRLAVSLTLNSHTDIDLAWLQRQPCDLLNVGVSIFTWDSARHSALIQQLSRLDLHNLRLLIDADGSDCQATQQLWSSLHVQEAQIILGPSSCKAAAKSRMTLAALPCSSRRMWIFPYAGSLFIPWAALAHPGGDIAIDLAGSANLHVLSADCPDPDSLQHPWQLLVLGTCSVPGLPPASQPSQTADDAYFLQNAAARAAGWTQLGDSHMVI